MPEPVVELSQLRYRYTAAGGRWVLDGLDLKVEPGEFILLCGASGSGKSTLCRTFNGLIPHFHGGQFEGRVFVAGMDTRLHPVSELFAHASIVFQNPEAQLFTATVERELAFGLESLGLARHEIYRRIELSAEIVGVTHLLQRDPFQLSRGEQHLVAIAAALALQPKLIVLDEPYANLDPANIGRVRAALREINRRGTAIVLTEHRLHGPLADASRMLVLDRGRLVLDGPPRALLSENLEALGLERPLPVRLAHELGLAQIPLTIEELVQELDGQRPLPDWPDALPAPSRRPGRVIVDVERATIARDGRPLFQDITLQLREGECLALLGANGAGKTTLIKHLNGLYHPARGRVIVAGQDTRRTTVSRLARHVGLAFQNPNDQFFRFQVRDEIEAGARALGRYDRGWLQEVIDLLHLEPLLDRSPYKLSEGEKKRVAFAAALSARPDILVLDEPTAGQDWTFRRSLSRLLDDLRARGQAVVLVTHDLEFAEQHATRWVLLGDGRVLAEGEPWTVMGDGSAMRLASLEPTQRFQLRASLSKRAGLQEAD